MCIRDSREASAISTIEGNSAIQRIPHDGQDNKTRGRKCSNENPRYDLLSGPLHAYTRQTRPGAAARACKHFMLSAAPTAMAFPAALSSSPLLMALIALLALIVLALSLIHI